MMGWGTVILCLGSPVPRRQIVECRRWANCFYEDELRLILAAYWILFSERFWHGSLRRICGCFEPYRQYPNGASPAFAR